MGRILVLSGVGPYADPWHPFERTTPAIAEVLRDAGYAVEVRETVAGSMLDLASFDLLVVNAGGGIADEPESPSAEFDDDLGALGDYLDAGGRALSIHTSNGAFRQQPKWRAAVGGNWGPDSWHPEISDATFEPAARAEKHPVWAGLDAVEVFDEKYSRLDIDEGVTPLVQHTLEGRDQVMGWAVRGQVVFDGLGHDELSYQSASRRQLLLNEVAWLLRT
ncbi:ThuA domain-containing protein [Tessaracoccus sp. MC1865]|uniref:ThuA domain-containing protein n=1 Tax=Tessaracoccus sp. MC1865 TaxID=2760310 RepID=UPI0016019F4C|nr:ThuA domain-containing protein [Tessaracoccus sp. MC1865]MBB1484222.1 ThuA domain-containing protein [Tessaracoccus sp. MC1865]QTO37241.1 ThuA domain-containing protein [Tessaracoccus sp. MC1865]